MTRPPRLPDGVPGFVTRGLGTLADSRDITSVRYANEADLRDAMALTWWLAGWSVRTEVKVPDCGRIDVLAEGLDTTVIIELKKCIKTSGQSRAAFQQAHAYSAYLTKGQSHTFVTAADIDWDVTSAAERAFPFIYCWSFLSVAESATSTEWPETPWLARIARNRRDELRSLADLSAGAAAVMTNRSELRLLHGGEQA